MDLPGALYLLDGTTREHVEAILIENVDDHRLELVDSNWQSFLQPIIEARCGYLRQLEQSWVDFTDMAYRRLALNSDWLGNLPENPHWVWRNKGFGIHSRSFAVECQGSTQGLMFLRLDKTARYLRKAGQPLVYIDYLGTAPWNNIGLVEQPRFRGTGFLLVRAAVVLSLNMGKEGIIGLHSLPGAEDFYGNHQKCGLTDFGVDPIYENLRYFEMDPSNVQGFLNRTA